MMPPHQPIDLVALVALLLGMVSSTQVSGQLAPYVLVAGAAAFSAWLAAGDKDTDAKWSPWRTARLIVQRTALAVFVAVGLSWGVQSATGLDWRWTLPGIAVVIAYVDHGELIRLLWARIKIVFGASSSAPPPPGDKP